MRIFHPLILAAIVVCSLHSQAQVSVHSVVPAAPSSADLIAARVIFPGFCEATFTTTVTGTLVRTDVYVYGCIGGGPPPFDIVREAEFGPLMAGTYTYEVYASSDTFPTPQLIHQQSIVVTPAAAVAPVPALSGLQLVLFVIAISATALVVLRRPI